jgi:transketolase N-terminal domain/subunit
MSYSLQAAGKIDDVIKQVKAHEFVGGDTSQAEAAKAFILAELEAWPAATEHRMRGAIVESSGHHDNYSRNISITIRALYLKD